jgi:hypothetical protein
MLSTLLDVLGFAAFTAATYLLAGPAGALYVAGACLLITSLGVNDDAAATHVRRLVGPVRRRARAIRQRLHRTKE